MRIWDTVSVLLGKAKKLRHPASCYVLLSDRDERVLSHAVTLGNIRQLRKQYEDAMGQGVVVTAYRVESLSVVEEEL